MLHFASASSPGHFARLLAAAWLATSIALAGCWPGDADPTRPRDGSPDAQPYDPGCGWHCGEGFECRGGEVVEHGWTTPSGACSWSVSPCGTRPAGIECAQGCREGATVWTRDRARALELCIENGPKLPGDPCVDDAECAPGALVDDGFGGQEPLALGCDVERGACVELAVERCNAQDDDADEAVDEGCVAVPARVADVAASGSTRSVAFGPERIALLHGAVETAMTLTMVDPEGVELQRVDSDLTFASRVDRVEGGFALLRHVPAPTPIHEIVIVGDDGSRRTISLASPPSPRYARLVPFGSGFAILGEDGAGGAIPVQVHDAEGQLVGRSSVTVDSPVVAGSALLDDGSLLVVTSGERAERIRIAADGTATRLDAPDREYRGLSAIAAAGDELFVAAHGTFHDALVGIDPASGAWRSEVMLGSIPHLWALSSASEGVALSWLDGTVLRTLSLDVSSARRAATAIDVALSGSGVMWSGETREGARVVLTTATGWRLVAPLEAP